MLATLTDFAFAPSRRRLRLCCAWASYAAILILGSVPGARADLGQLASGLVLHSAAYAIITYGLLTGMRGPLRRRALLAVLTVAAMGALDEYVQSFFPYRHAAVGDWLVDCSAASLSALAQLAWLPARAR
ncbi:MAG: VanZ family protein [Pseudomonadota bacterium]